MTAGLASWLKNKVEIENLLGEIVKERLRQDQKWGEQNHTPAIWCTILGEEVGEVNKAALEAWAAKDSQGNQRWDVGMLAEYRKELIQVAAVAISMVQCLDRDKWPK